MAISRFAAAFTLALCIFAAPVDAGGKDKDSLWVVYDGGDGPGKGKHIVLVSGDEEYRSEEALPQLGKILAGQHGFTCTVLFAIDPKDGTINPNVNNNIPGLEALKSADLMIIATRFRNLPDNQMALIDAYVHSGKPIIGMRTATHAFNLKGGKFNKYTWTSKEWPGGFGKQILGETWVAHHGAHGKESTRGIIAPGKEKHPVTRGIKDGDVWGPTDVYAVKLPLAADAEPIIMGQVVAGMKPTDPPVTGKKNEPMMPVAWTRSVERPGSAQKTRVFTTTMGSSTDLESAGTRRLLVNATYWALDMADRIPDGGSRADIVGDYRPTPFSFNGFRKGVRPADMR